MQHVGLDDVCRVSSIDASDDAALLFDGDEAIGALETPDDAEDSQEIGVWKRIVAIVGQPKSEAL